MGGLIRGPHNQRDENPHVATVDLGQFLLLVQKQQVIITTLTHKMKTHFDFLSTINYKLRERLAEEYKQRKHFQDQSCRRTFKLGKMLEAEFDRYQKAGGGQSWSEWLDLCHPGALS